MIEITKEEAALVEDLLKLWDTSYENNPCKHDCKCPRCAAMENVGEHSSWIYKSLEAKVERGAK